MNVCPSSNLNMLLFISCTLAPSCAHHCELILMIMLIKRLTLMLMIIMMLTLTLMLTLMQQLVFLLPSML